MARGMLHEDRSMPSELYGDEQHSRSMAGDLNTERVWKKRDEDDLAYGKDYSDRQRRKRGGSYDRTRDRRRSSPPPPC